MVFNLLFRTTYLKKINMKIIGSLVLYGAGSFG